ncbi:MAG: glycosyltransferase [Halanaerobiales bacterium]|nr:glycosyltransferase [Halanaerobiales bacterium]
MKIVFWLDPKVGFDRNTPEILSSFADGLALRGYDVELLVQDQELDDYIVENVSKRIWYEEGSYEIIADVLISNRLENLLKEDLHQTCVQIWLALEEDITEPAQYFENYQLNNEIRVFTLFPKVKDELARAGIEGELIQPGLKLECFKINQLEREDRRITISLFNEHPEAIKAVLFGLEMARMALEPLKVRLIVDHNLEFKATFPIEVKVKPGLKERIQYYQDSDLFIHIPGDEKFSLLPLEVMALGLPLVLLTHPGVVSYAHDRNNCLMLKSLVPKEIALSILNVVKIGKIREQLKIQGPKTSQNYNLEQSLQNLEKLWETTSLLNRMKMKDLNFDANANRLIDLVIVNCNSGIQIRECLTSLREYTHEPHRIIVVDNNSEDESLEYLKKEEGICLILNQQNTGFAKACNQGILAGKGKYICLLHGDIQVTENWLSPLLEEIQKPEVGMVVPRKNKHSESLIEEQNPLSSDPTGGCVIIKRDNLNRVGLLDEKFYLHYENLDYSLRIQEKGYVVSYCSESVILHNNSSLYQIEEEDNLELRKHFYSQSEEYFEEKWGVLIQDKIPERIIDGIIILSLHPWQKKAQRTEAMVDYFARHGQKVVYVEPYCASLPPQSLGQNQYLYVLKGTGTIYHNLSNVGRRIDLMQELKTQIAEWGIENPILIVESPWWEPVIKHIENRLLIYTVPEILMKEEMENFQQLKEKFVDEEKSIVKDADLIIVASRLRLKELELYQDKLLYSPGGFYPTDLERFLQGHFTMPDELISFSGYRVGIIGTLDRYFPKQLLKKLAFQHPEVSFIFMGEITCNLNELKEIPNFYFLGNKGWDHLLDSIYFFDIMLYPYPDKGLNSYLDPYIVNYYLAMGKPVVAFKHQEIERFGQVVKNADDESEFIELVSQIIGQLTEEKSEEKIKERIHQVAGFGWEERFDDLYQRITVRVPILEIPCQLFIEDEFSNEREVPFIDFIKQLLRSWKKLRWGSKNEKSE